MVKLKNLNGGPTDWREPGEGKVIPAEVMAPIVLTWIEEWHGFANTRHSNLDAIRFVQIAARTRPSQVVKLRETAKAARHNVLDVKRSPL